MTNKHHRWQTRWMIDLATCRATHDSGVIVQFTQAEDDAAAWDGTPIDDPELFAALLAKHGGHNIGPHFARLMREAGQLYEEALHARH